MSSLNLLVLSISYILSYNLFTSNKALLFNKLITIRLRRYVFYTIINYKYSNN